MLTVTRSFYTPSRGDVVEFLDKAGINAGDIRIPLNGLVTVEVYSGKKDDIPRKLFAAGGLFQGFDGDDLSFLLFVNWRKKVAA